MTLAPTYARYDVTFVSGSGGGITRRYVGLEIAEFEASPGGGLPEEAEPLLAAVSPLVAASARLSKEGYGPS